MSSISQIPIQVLPAGDGLTGQAEAVLAEVAEMLGRLLETGKGDSIDLRSLPLSPADKAWLDEQLGRGEVEILLDAGGDSTLTETAYSGVWKVVHRDIDGRVIVELIEVGYVPEIVLPTSLDIQASCDKLQSSLKQIS
jgi:hydrogenase-1 operon protein HyaF